MKTTEAWGVAILSVVLLSATLLGAVLFLAVFSRYPLIGILFGAASVTSLSILWKMLPRYDRFSRIWSLLPPVILADFAFLLIYQGIDHGRSSRVMLGIGALILLWPATRRVARQLQYYRFPRILRWIRPHVPLERRLALLAECGIRLNPCTDVDSLRESDQFGYLDDDEYDGVVMIMGGWGKGLAEPTFSDDVWYNDIECITQPEDYARVAKHLQRLSKGNFAIENVRAETDEDGAEVALKFTLHGKDYDLWAPLDDDMIEVEVWAELQGLFESCCQEGRRLESILYGQDGCYFYITGEQKECLEKLGLKFFR